jgi:Ca-activated chloride channel family protein
VRFTSVDLLASVAPRRPGWQRHIPAVLLLGALGLLAVSIAHPNASRRVARNRATIMLALDTSASMSATDVRPSRLQAAEEQAKAFVKGLPSGLQIGLVSFDRNARVLVSPTTDHDTVLAAIASLAIGPGTATADAIDLSLQAIHSVPPAADGTPAPAVVVLMSDGTPTIGHDDLSPEQAVTQASAAARTAGVPVNTIAFGTADGTVDVQGRTVAVPVDPAAMARIAQDTGGATFTAANAGQLKAVYSQIQKAVGFDVKRHDISAVFTVLALVLAVLAAAAAMLWTERML